MRLARAVRAAAGLRSSGTRAHRARIDDLARHAHRRAAGEQTEVLIRVLPDEDVRVREVAQLTIERDAAAFALDGAHRVRTLGGPLAARLAQPEAEQRIDQVMATIKTAAEEAKAAADKIRRATVIVAFITAASLVVSAAAAWWAAAKAGWRSWGAAWSTRA